MPLSGAVNELAVNEPDGTVFPPSAGSTVIDDAEITFACKLTDPDGVLSDLTLPISSFTARRRSGRPSYLQVVVPSLDNIDGIRDREGGDLYIERTEIGPTGATQTQEVARTVLETIRTDEGTKSETATLQGYKTQTTSDPVTRPMSGVSYRSDNDGDVTIRCTADSALRPGDTADVSSTGDKFTIDEISWTVRVRRGNFETTMEIKSG